MLRDGAALHAPSLRSRVGGQADEIVGDQLEHGDRRPRADDAGDMTGVEFGGPRRDAALGDRREDVTARGGLVAADLPRTPPSATTASARAATSSRRTVRSRRGRAASSGTPPRRQWRVRSAAPVPAPAASRHGLRWWFGGDLGAGTAVVGEPFPWLVVPSRVVGLRPRRRARSSPPSTSRQDRRPVRPPAPRSYEGRSR